MTHDASVTYPIPISRVAHRYYVYNVDHVTHLRREHNIPGILVGTLPQSPQQNIFLGLPLQLLAEEARLLVEKDIAYIVDDAISHREGLKNLTDADRRKYVRVLNAQGEGLQRATADQALAKKEQILSRLPPDRREKVQAAIDSEKRKRSGVVESGNPTVAAPTVDDDESEQLFSPLKYSESPDAPFESRQDTPSGASTPSRTSALITKNKYHHITPTLSDPPFSIPAPVPSGSEQTSEDDDVRRSPSSPRGDQPQHWSSLPDVHSQSAYALYKHLHSQSYFLSAGLRFGAQYSVYPGDPLRFHAHFLARGYDWDEEIDLLSLVGGGRLGTGVKKGYLIGGPVSNSPAGPADTDTQSDQQDQAGEVRCFCIEWAGM